MPRTTICAENAHGQRSVARQIERRVSALKGGYMVPLIRRLLCAIALPGRGSWLQPFGTKLRAALGKPLPTSGWNPWNREPAEGE